MPDVITFEEAIRRTEGRGRHALLGNGFSIACRPDIFTYGRLLDRADLTGRPEARAAFDRLGTTDFELVMNGLTRAAALAEVYQTTDKALKGRFEADAEALKEILVQAIAGSHPDRPAAITAAEYGAARSFLRHFERVYSVSYDILAYWAYLQQEVEPHIDLPKDGFRQPEDGPREWVEWDMSRHDQSLFYLHGALHIYQDGPEIRKYTWSNTGIPLMDQIRASLDEGKFPLFVAEGSCEEKMERIQRSSFLGRSFRSFREIGGTLFVHGLSFSDSDDHILDAIVHNKVTKLMVSLFGDPTDAGNRAIIQRVEALKQRRLALTANRPRATDVEYYDAASADVWGAAG